MDYHINVHQNFYPNVPFKCLDYMNSQNALDCSRVSLLLRVVFGCVVGELESNSNLISQLS